MPCLVCFDDFRGVLRVCEVASPCTLTMPHAHCMSCFHTVFPGAPCCAMQYLRTDAQLQEDLALGPQREALDD